MDSDAAYRILPRPRGLLFWLRWLATGVLVLVLLAIAFVVLYYVYEDISGWLAWSRAKKQLQAEGFSLDPQTYLPAPIPDAENFGALPFFQLQPDPDRPDVHLPLAWETTLHPFVERIPYSRDDTDPPDHFPYLSRWSHSEKPDMDAARQRFVELGAKASPPVTFPPNTSATEMFSLLCPPMADLRKENAARPLCVFNWNREPGAMDYGRAVTNLIGLAKLLAYEESLSIQDQQPQVALDDLKVGWKLQSGLARETTLLSELVGMGVTAIQIGAVEEGLHSHAWNDAQLAELDADLGKLDFLSNGRHALQADLVTYYMPLTLRYAADRSQMTADVRRNILQMKEVDRATESALKASLAKDKSAGDAKVVVDDFMTRDENLTLWMMYWWPPTGNLYRNLAGYAQFILPSAKEALDPEAHRAYPEKIRSVPESMPTLKSLLNAIEKSATAQVEIDEARIACRLERYRLAHQSYPASLDELVPAFGNDLPRDVMTGEPYHYKRDGDTYVLYSVAWNQKDDGGDTAKNSYFTSDSPDWVWPNHPRKK